MKTSPFLGASVSFQLYVESSPNPPVDDVSIAATAAVPRDAGLRAASPGPALTQQPGGACAIALSAPAPIPRVGGRLCSHRCSAPAFYSRG